MGNPIQNDLKADLLDNAPVIIAFINMDHNIVWANRTYQETTGLSMEEIEGNKCHIIRGLAEPCRGCPVKIAIKTGECCEAELTPQNQEQWTDNQGSWLVRATPTKSENGSIIGSIMVAYDITERKKTEEALQRSEERLRLLIENTSDIVIMQDLTGKYLYYNSPVVYGFKKENLLGKTPFDFHPPEIAAQMMNRLNHTISTGLVVNEETKLDWQGEILWFLDQYSPVKDSTGKIVAVATISRNITDRKKVEETLRESEEQLNTLIDAMPDFICFKDGDGRWLKANDAGIRIFQLEGIDYQGKTDSELAELNNRLQGAFLTCKKSDAMAWNEKRLFTQEESISQSDGKVRVFDVTKVPVFHSDGRRKGILVIGHDITEHKKAEDALRESEEKYRSLTENMSDIVYSMNLNGILTYISPQTKQYGLDPDTLVSRNMLKIVHPEDRDKIAEEFQRVFETGKEFSSIFRALDAKGEIQWFEDIGKIQYDKEGNISGLAGVLRNITERKQTEKALRESEQNFRDMTNLLPQTVFEIDTYGNLTFVNKQAFDSFGYSQAELEKGIDVLQMLIPSDRKELKENIQNSLHGKNVKNSEYTAVRKDGSTFPIVIYSSAILEDNKPVGLRGIIVNTTELKHAEKEKAQIEDQYRQAQKMESVGRLAGGVAHDFNNMLGVILGYTEMLQNKVDPDQPVYAALQEIHKAADRSADLTRQLLAFARRQTVSPKVLELNETVEGMLKMLRRLIGEDIDLAWLPGTDLWPIMMDPAQIDQILANLCVNGRDAIEGVGKMTIETRNVVLNKFHCKEYPGSIPGDYVLLTVSDDGCGMEKETLSNLFEPFFTTKEVGRGTGLGLATVYGIIKQNNGFIYVCSELDEETTFKIYLPRHMGIIAPIQKKDPTEPVRHGHETILLVEDEPAILEMGTTMLETQGYTVLAATIPSEAIRMAGKYDSEIHLLMTDVVMPEMNGRDLAKKLLSLRPNIKYLFMSGYTANVIAHRRVLDDGINFIQKPFTIQDLSARVREVLDSE